jgi:deoxyribose-phosphate aldolase
LFGALFVLQTFAFMAIHQYIEHTNLSPLITSTQVEQLVQEAIEHQFVGVCVPPFWVKKAARDIGKQPIAVVTVIGFPLGYQRTEAKLKEIELAIQDGATELDMVLDLSCIKTGTDFWAKAEIARCAKLCHDNEKVLKVILETAYLNEAEIIACCKLCEDAGADFVKTSTGFAPTGATVEQIALMRKTVSKNVGVKASGGIRTLAHAQAMIAAGADRIGTSTGIKIMEELQKI